MDENTCSLPFCGILADDIEDLEKNVASIAL